MEFNIATLGHGRRSALARHQRLDHALSVPRGSAQSRILAHFSHPAAHIDSEEVWLRRRQPGTDAVQFVFYLPFGGDSTEKVATNDSQKQLPVLVGDRNVSSLIRSA